MTLRIVFITVAFIGAEQALSLLGVLSFLEKTFEIGHRLYN